MAAVTVRVTGQVQGVGYRAYAARQAAAHGVAGWARNEPDGGVTVLAEGPDGAVAALLADLRAGPRSAVVEDLDTTDTDPTGASGFTTH